MIIPFLNLNKINNRFKKQFTKIMGNLLTKGEYILGSELKKFEKEFSKYCDSKYSLGVGNGYDALFLILKALDIKKGDEILVQKNTFIATWMAISNIGATPIAVDFSSKDFSICCKDIKKKITKKTKAILAVHLYGVPCDVSKLKKICRENKIFLIEDCAQAHGATFRNKKVGSFGIASAFSFYPSKNLGALGDGGAVVTNNKKIYLKIVELRNYGSTQKNIHNVIGFNSRLDEIQAAFLRKKLSYLDMDNSKRRKIAELYLKELKESDVELPIISKSCYSVWHLFVIRVKKRDYVLKKMLESGIECMIHYPLFCDQQQAYGVKNQFNSSTNDLLSLPISPVMTKKEAMKVTSTLKKIL